MAERYDPKGKHDNYIQTMFYRKLMRDVISGPAAIKNSGELYLPMPSGWNDPELIDSYNQSAGIFNQGNNNSIQEVANSYLPWSHKNPAYRAYLQRAKFPDITANSLRLMLGIATKTMPEVDLPSNISYLEKSATFQEESLNQLFAECVSEVCSVSKIVLVADVSNDQFKIAPYLAESNINWEYEVINGVERISRCSFDDVWEGLECVKEFFYDEEGFVSFQIFLADEETPTHVEPLMYRGKPYPRIPVFPIGAMRNHLDSQNIPLVGIADIAITLYQMSADLRQAQFMTCNPTLFISGANEREKPQMLGTQVVVMLKNPQAKAEYPPTDTSALEHIREDMKDYFQEAVIYGASLIRFGAGDSGEALSIRKADSGSSLVHVITMVGEGISSALEFIAELHGSGSDQIVFEPNKEFAEVRLGANEINSIVNAWLSGAIDLDTVIDNLRDSGYVDEDKTNDQIKSSIESEAPKVMPSSDGSKDKNKDKGDEDKDQNQDEK